MEESEREELIRMSDVNDNRLNDPQQMEDDLLMEDELLVEEELAEEDRDTDAPE